MPLANRTCRPMASPGVSHPRTRIAASLITMFSHSVSFLNNPRCDRPASSSMPIVSTKSTAALNPWMPCQMWSGSSTRCILPVDVRPIVPNRPGRVTAWLTPSNPAYCNRASFHG